MDTIIGEIGGLKYTIGDSVLEFSYLLAAVAFIVGLKFLSHPESARKRQYRGNTGYLARHR